MLIHTKGRILLEFLSMMAVVIVVESCGNGGKGEKVEEEIIGEAATDGEHVGVDLGLSVWWASVNIGAKSPEKSGLYLAWAETSPKDAYYESNCQTFIKDLGDIGGQADYDPATALWGEGWRTPTRKEMEELSEKCQWAWVDQGDSTGYIIKGPNGNSIFLPAAGRYYGETLFYEGGSGHYWCSTPSSPQYAFFLFMTRGRRQVGFRNRHYGFTVRAVMD